LKANNSFGQYDNENYFFASMGYKKGDYAGRANTLSIHQIVFDKNYEKILFEDRVRLNERVRDIIFLKNKNSILAFLEKKGSLILLSYDQK
tara:strand:+ start:1995 stop:2267 length:273 start_codon:yes stop_codon:yes gene_type:complete